MPHIKEGQKAPKFSLSDKDGVVHKVPVAGEYTVIFFYPKDNTPGCTIEAKEFSAMLKKFTARGVTVFGISGGTDKTKASFCAKQKLAVTLLTDGDFTVAAKYGAFGEKKFMGRTYNGILRKTFIIDKRGVVVKIFDSVKPAGHAEEVLAGL
jgi:peroxiredoxin Q/BCP